MRNKNNDEKHEEARYTAFHYYVVDLTPTQPHPTLPMVLNFAAVDTLDKPQCQNLNVKLDQ